MKMWLQRLMSLGTGPDPFSLTKCAVCSNLTPRPDTTGTDDDLRFVRSEPKHSNHPGMIVDGNFVPTPCVSWSLVPICEGCLPQRDRINAERSVLRDKLIEEMKGGDAHTE